MSNEYKEWIEDLKTSPVGSEEHNRWLVYEYPFLIPRYWDTGEVVRDYDYSYTELDNMPEGWRKAFGLQMCKDIKKALIANNCLDDFRFLQIKDKFGGLRIYTTSVPKEVNNIIDKYENKSYYTCIMCGKPATQVSQNWISPYCDECVKEEQARLKYEKFVPIDKYYK